MAMSLMPYSADGRKYCLLMAVFAEYDNTEPAQTHSAAGYPEHPPDAANPRITEALVQRHDPPRDARRRRDQPARRRPQRLPPPFGGAGKPAHAAAAQLRPSTILHLALP